MKTDGKYKIVQLGNSQITEWNKFVDESKEGTIFHKSFFIESFPGNHLYFLIYKGEHAKAGLCFTADMNNESDINQVPGIIHNGIIFHERMVDSNSNSKLNSIKFEITTFIVDFLTKNFRSIQLQLSPHVMDIRPFQWFNYHSVEQDKFNLDVRYTSFLDISEINESESLDVNTNFGMLGISRRQEIRYALRNKIKVKEEMDTDKFLCQYVEKAALYNSDIDSSCNQIKNTLSKLSENGNLKLYQVVSEQDIPMAYAVFGWDLKRAYYLYGTTSNNARESYGGSYLLWESFRELRKMGILEVDLEGINSPQRGWFKLSFGGNLMPYYRLTLSRG